MELIIDFYQGLDTLNLIIFWGIIIVIILLLIFSFILINKNKKLKNIVATTLKKEEDLPIKKIEIDNSKEENINNYGLEKNETLKTNEEKEIVLPNIPKMPKVEETKPIETEKNFIAEEHVMKYNNDDFVLSNIKKTNEETYKPNNEASAKRQISNDFEMPTKPYQRNVLREMSLSQTSPIGITRPINKEDKKIEIAKDLEESLNEIQEEKTKEIIRETNMMQNEVIKKELTKIDDYSQRKTEIKHDDKITERKIPNEINQIKEETKISEKNYNQNNMGYYNNNFGRRNEALEKKSDISKNSFTESQREEYKKEDTQEKNYTNTNNEYIPPQVRELLDKPSLHQIDIQQKSSSEKYLEEVSKKLAEAEIPDEIERTDYELEQEENAIISYKELMEKKDSIQTIDEEEAIISIEELMNKSNQNKEKKNETKEDTKLYNLTEEEENDNFLKELKQFRSDL